MTQVSLQLEVDNKRLLLALRRSPKNLENNLSKAMSSIIARIAKTAREDAPKANSALVDSIQARRINALTGIVRPGVNYAKFVEGGRDPGKRPPFLDIWQWVRVKKIQPDDPNMSERDLAWAIARSIGSKGIQPQPFLEPAAKEHEVDARKRVNDAITKTLESMA